MLPFVGATIWVPNSVGHLTPAFSLIGPRGRQPRTQIQDRRSNANACMLEATPWLSPPRAGGEGAQVDGAGERHAVAGGGECRGAQISSKACCLWMDSNCSCLPTNAFVHRP